MATQAQRNARNKYNKAHYKDAMLHFKIGTTEVFDEFAKKNGISFHKAVMWMALYGAKEYGKAKYKKVLSNIWSEMWE